MACVRPAGRPGRSAPSAPASGRNRSGEREAALADAVHAVGHPAELLEDGVVGDGAQLARMADARSARRHRSARAAGREPVLSSSEGPKVPISAA